MLAEVECNLEDFPKFDSFFELAGERIPPFLAQMIAENANPVTWPSLLPQILEKQKLDQIPDAQTDFPATAEIGSNVYVHKSVSIPKDCVILANTFVGPEVELRPGCYIRGNSVILARSVVGHCSEVKNALLFEEAQVPHFNYVGDAVLGRRAHLGAGAVLSNYRFDGGEVVIKHFYGENVYLYETGVNKFSALMGDGAQVGCNSVVCPGSVLEKCQLVGPCQKWSGWRHE